MWCSWVIPSWTPVTNSSSCQYFNHYFSEHNKTKMARFALKLVQYSNYSDRTGTLAYARWTFMSQWILFVSTDVTLCNSVFCQRAAYVLSINIRTKCVYFLDGKKRSFCLLKVACFVWGEYFSLILAEDIPLCLVTLIKNLIFQSEHNM